MTAATQRPAPRPLTGGAVMAGTSRIAVAVTGAITTILVARALGPRGSGGYALAQSLLLLLQVATTLGVEHGIAYFVSSGRWTPARAYAAAVRMSLLAGVAGYALGLGLRLALPGAFGQLGVGLTAVALAALPFALLLFYVPYVALAADRYEAYVVPPAVQSALALVLAGAGALTVGLTGAVVGLALSYAVTGLGAAAWAARRLGREGERGLGEAVSFGVRGYAANALQMLNYRADLFVLAAVAGATAVGRYSVAIAVTSVLTLAPQAVSEVLFPRVARLSASPGADAAAHRDMVEVKGLRHVTLAVVVMIVVLALALLLLVTPIYGDAFRPAIVLGLILLPGVGLNAISGVLAATVVGRGRPGHSLRAVSVSTPVTMALYALLIPWLGATGAALASSISYTINFLVLAVLYSRLTGRSLLRSLVPTRSEWRDLRALPKAVVARTRRARR